MGYYTDFTIETKDDLGKNAMTDLIELSDCDFQGGTTIQPVKWYGWEEDIKIVSKKYPDVTFILDGVGEEYPDIWRAWARNGRVEKVKADIVFKEPFWV